VLIQDLDAEEMGLDTSTFVRHREEYKPPATPITPSLVPTTPSLPSSNVVATPVPVTPYSPAPAHTPHTPHTPHLPVHTPHTPHQVPITPHTPHTPSVGHHDDDDGHHRVAAPFYPFMKVTLEGRKDNDGNDREAIIIGHDHGDRWFVRFEGVNSVSNSFPFLICFFLSIHLIDLSFELLLDIIQLSLPVNELRKVDTTVANSLVVVLSGEKAGQYGRLVAMDNGEGIVDLEKDSSDQVYIS
jgi:hypothetical protein